SPTPFWNAAATYIRRPCPSPGRQVMGQATKPDFGAATDALELPIIFLAADTSIVGFNPAAARLLGLTASNVPRSIRTIDALADMVADIEELTEHVAASGAAVQREV